MKFNLFKQLLISTGILLCLAPNPSFGQEGSELPTELQAHFQIQGFEVESKSLAQEDSLPRDLRAKTFSQRKTNRDLKSVETTLDQIINIGKKVWQIIKDGKAVAQTTKMSANALPQEVTQWQQMTGWKNPVSRTYKVTYKNVLGATVVEFQYRVSLIPGGRYKGRGLYLTQASVTPLFVKVAWGYALSSSVEIPALVNQGTEEDPIAAMQMDVKWVVENPLTSVEQSQSHFVTGKGEITKM